MKINAIRLFNVRQFARRGVAIEGIGDGVNVLCAANETGKSTSFEALHALFFQLHTGKPRDVQRLQPYGGGNPLIEVDILVPQGRFRLTKQFIGGKRATVEDLDKGRLIAQADEAESFISEQITGGPGGPAGLLWLRQGMTGLEERSKTEEEADRRVRESLLTSVQGEVEAMTGGRRMSTVLDMCGEHLGRLVTATLKPKANGPFAAAIDEHLRLLADSQRLAAEVETLRTALDKRAMASRRLSELENTDERAQRHSAVDRAEAAFEAAKHHGEVLRKLEAETTLARTQHAAAEHDLTLFWGGMRRTEKMGSELTHAILLRDTALLSRSDASAANAQALAEAHAAEAEERAARERLVRLDAAERARRAADLRDALQLRLARAEALRAEEEEREAALALIAIPASVIATLQELEIRIAGLRAADLAHMPTLTVRYEAGTAGPITMAGVPMAEGRPYGVEEQVCLDIAGVGTVTVRSNRSAEAGREVRDAQALRRDVLATHGIADLADGLRRQIDAQGRAVELQRIRLEIRQLAPDGLARLREEVARHDASLAAQPEVVEDPEAARDALAQASPRVEAAREAMRLAQIEHGRSADALVEAERVHARLRGEMAQLDASLGEEAGRADRAAKLAAVHEERASALAAMELQLSRHRSRAPDIETASAALRRARAVEQQAQEELAQTRIALAELNGQIRSRSDNAVEEQWQEAREALSAAAARVKAYETEIAVLTRLRTALEQSRTAARDLYLQPVLSELAPLLGILFDDIAIAFDEKTLLPQSIRRNGLDEEIERLSGGMREQLSVLTRLAFARLLARDGRPAPIILDDALVYSDDDRIERMFDALHRQSSDQQIIVFSCRQRAFSRLGGTVLHMTDWTPPAA